MAIIHLIRTSKERNAVRGTATIPMWKDAILCATLENADYIIPEGTYQLVNTTSPRFKKILPLVSNVPGRSCIRIHTGTRPEHSKGCVLVTAFGRDQIIEFINQKAKQNEKVHLTISSDGLRGA